jgi:hypothetical protein
MSDDSRNKLSIDMAIWIVDIDFFETINVRRPDEQLR